MTTLVTHTLFKHCCGTRNKKNNSWEGLPSPIRVSTPMFGQCLGSWAPHLLSIMDLFLNSLCFMDDIRTTANSLLPKQNKKHKAGAKNNMRSVMLNTSSRNPQPKEPGQRVTAAARQGVCAGQGPMIRLFQHSALFTAKHKDLSRPFLSPLQNTLITMVTV